LLAASIFCGPVAFVGLSQVRESAIFNGIPITERKQDRTCRVWAIHLETGQILGFVKFIFPDADLQRIPDAYRNASI
jgi:hypothetical protein